MEIDSKELKISYRENLDLVKVSEITSKVRPMKGLKIINYLIPIFILIVYILFYVLDYLTYGFSVKRLIYHHLIPFTAILLFYIIMDILVKRFSKRFTKKIADTQLDDFKKFPREISWTFSNEGINVNSTITDSILSWDYIEKVLETEDAIYFYLSKIHFKFIIKRILDENQILELRQIISRNVNPSLITFDLKDEIFDDEYIKEIVQGENNGN